MRHCWVSGERSYPAPSISVYPNETVALGGTVNIRCRSDYNWLPEGARTQFHLQKQTSSDFEMWRNEVAEHDEVVFPIVDATPSDAGLYRCVYCFQRHSCEVWSYYSEPINISVRGEVLAQSLDVAFRNVSKRVVSNADLNSFEETRVSKIRLEEVETAFPLKCCMNWVTEEAPVSFFSFLKLYRHALQEQQQLWKSSQQLRSTINKRTQPLPVKRTNLSLEPEAEGEAEDDPDEVSYAVLNQYSLKRQEAAKPDSIPES
ncbi:hypothetical protein lerEdw1_006990 [Lerista edwardsae]|nr:hypothetical protein lerEdw1_006990 [Lerista edwardsae]